MILKENVQDVKFVGSFPKLDLCPKELKPEYAFIGRSNVGKSSLINYLTNRKKLALTSSSAGKTRMINFFNVNDQWHLVDLPGYGYAYTSKKERARWLAAMDEYLAGRQQLVCAMLLIDFSIPIQKSDMERAQWLVEREVPFAFVFTKVDKLKQKYYSEKIATYEEAFLEKWASLPPMYFASVKNQLGKETILNSIFEFNNGFYEQIN